MSYLLGLSGLKRQASSNTKLMRAAAVVISTPEYNRSISGVLKNALDWISRADGALWANKPAAFNLPKKDRFRARGT